MNAIMKLSLAQREYDGRLPEESETAEQCWVWDNASRLVSGEEVRFQRFGKAEQVVTVQMLDLELEQVFADLSSRPKSAPGALGKMLRAVDRGDLEEARKALSEALVGGSLQSAALDVAEGLLRPLATDGVIAQQEDSL